MTTAIAFGCCLAALVGLVVRYRRARGTLRTQLRWFVAALVALTVSVPPDLQIAVAPTVQPAHVSLWVRRPPEVR